jgi:hypothetical protein
MLHFIDVFDQKGHIAVCLRFFVATFSLSFIRNAINE